MEGVVFWYSQELHYRALVLTFYFTQIYISGAIGGTLPLVFYNHIAYNFPEVWHEMLFGIPLAKHIVTKYFFFSIQFPGGLAQIIAVTAFKNKLNSRREEGVCIFTRSTLPPPISDTLVTGLTQIALWNFSCYTLGCQQKYWHGQYQIAVPFFVILVACYTL